MLAALWHNPVWMRRLSGVLGMLALLVLLGTGVYWVTHRNIFAIQVIEVKASEAGSLRHFNGATARAAALPRILNATPLNFFTVNLDVVRQAFENVAWVREAQVSRLWPNRLLVEIEEHQVLAAWEDTSLPDSSSSSAYAFVNTQGELFAVNPAEAEDDANDDGLPEFSGPPGSEKQVTSRYRELTTVLNKLQLKPDQVRLSSRYAWTIHANRTSGNANEESAHDRGLIIELGREIEPNILERRIERMQVTFPLIAAQWPKPTLIDLRYPNGFALRAEGLKLDTEASAKARAQAKARAEKTAAQKRT